MELKKIEEIINYNFKNINILEEAINLNDLLYQNGKLFLEFYINEYLTKEFCFYDNESSCYDLKIIIELKNYLLGNDFLNDKFNKLGISNYLEVTDSLKLFLSIIGGILLDSKDKNYDLSYLLNLDKEILANLNVENNYFNLVNDWSKHKNKEDASYNVSFNGEYNAKVIVKQIDEEFEANGKTKLITIIEAFKKAYQYISDNNLILKMSDVIGLPSVENATNQLQELFVKGFIAEPVYKINLKGTVNGEDIWRCRCFVEGYKESFSADNSSKRSAKRDSAYEMLKYILEQE